MKETIIEWIRHFYYYQNNGQRNFSQEAYDAHSPYWMLGMFVAMLLVSYVIWILSRFIIVRSLSMVVDRSRITWDDYFVQNRVFRALAQIVPFLFMEYLFTIVFYRYPGAYSFFSKVTVLLIIYATIITISRVLNSFRDIISSNERFRDKPIQSYFQVIKIISIGVLLILMLSVITDRSPVFFLTSLGAISAILLLIFKDTILGFVGSIQMATNDIIRIGDWVTMEKFGADGDVEEINLTTVKVRNFDKTITTIPTYSFISDSFINWRGMQESDGRRIKRAVTIQIESIRFASPELLERLSNVRLLKEFVISRQQEIAEYNRMHGFQEDDELSARRQTNVGLFRRYIQHYLKQNPNINQNMTLMVRQLASTEKGLPLEIYCFSETREWEKYEEIMADIFDHIFAVYPHFNLQIFESPAGSDFRKLAENVQLPTEQKSV